MTPQELELEKRMVTHDMVTAKAYADELGAKIKALHTTLRVTLEKYEKHRQKLEELTSSEASK